MANTVTLEAQETKDKNALWVIYMLIGLQLFGLVLITYIYELETLLSLSKMLGIGTVGFLVNAVINKVYRPYFFAILSLILLVVVVGWAAMAVIFLIGTLAVIIATYVKPNYLKYGLLLLLFGFLAYLMVIKPEWMLPHIAILSILGTMFMFRLALFLYDKNYEKIRPSFVKDWSYFFMLPNMTMMLFPVVDYKLFLNRYYDDKAVHIYKKGVQWVALGVFHLVVYRFIYYYLLLPPSEVNDAVSFWHYVVTNYLLIIRLSGLFHISVGVLCLFGFNLPRVFDNYFLASGFADLWRRINIYFRDYVIRLFYYPMFFKIRKIGDLRAKVLTILVIFGLTWFLHSLQWFWLRGFFPIRMVDAVFWGLFGLLVAGNAIWESKKAKVRPDKKSWSYAAKMTAQILGMFIFMSVLWSIWSSTTMAEWLSIGKFAFRGEAAFYIGFFGSIILIWLIGTLIYKQFETRQYGELLDPDPKSKMATFWSMSMVIFLLIIPLEPVKNVLESVSGKELDGLLSQKLNEADEYLMIEGYYEEILVGNELTNPVGDLQEQGDRFKDSEAALIVEDMRNVVIKPNVKTIFKDRQFSTNQWAIRDRDYTRTPDENTIRVGFAGGSFVVGSGVADDEVFDEILEDKMNESSDELKYEFLNLGSSGYDIIQCMLDFEQRNHHEFEFDYLIYSSHGVDLHKNLKTVIGCYNHEFEIPYEYISDILKRSGITRDMTGRDQQKVLEPFDKELIEKSYKYFVEMCLKHDIQPVWLYWPTIASFVDQSVYLEKAARDAGFIIINVEEAFDGYIPEELIVSNKDRHPNEKAHKLVAEKLNEIFKEELHLVKDPLRK